MDPNLHLPCEVPGCAGNKPARRRVFIDWLPTGHVDCCPAHDEEHFGIIYDALAEQTQKAYLRADARQALLDRARAARGYPYQVVDYYGKSEPRIIWGSPDEAAFLAIKTSGLWLPKVFIPDRARRNK